MRVICINDSNVFYIYNGRVHNAIKDGDGFKLYIPKVDDWVFYERYRRVTEIVGGTKETKERVFRHLMNERRQNWGLSRMWIECYSGKAKLTYCAGQDQSFEMREIRKALK